MTATSGSDRFTSDAVPGDDNSAHAIGRPAPTKSPASILKLTNWKLTLPTGPVRNATQVQQPALGTFTDPNFRLNAAGDGVQFRAACDGITTSGSAYPRCELREMNGRAEASWSCAKGSAHLSIVESVDVLPPVKGQVVCAQIHNAESDVIEVLGDGLNSILGKKRVALTVRFRGQTHPRHLTDDYILGTRFRLDVGVAGGKITVGYNGVAKLTLSAADAGCYFKVGAYVQSNPSQGDGHGAYGQVTVYSVTVTHGN